MEAGSPTDIRPGLRERKKQKTRETIIKVALELFADQGYEQTTIAEIADAAEVAPRTIFAYFPSKEDILFYDSAEIQERLAHALRERPDGTTALDALREFIFGSLAPDSTKALRKCIVTSDETLQRSERARYAPLEQLMAEAIAEDLNAGPTTSGPRSSPPRYSPPSTPSATATRHPAPAVLTRTRYGSNRRRHKLPARRPRSAQTRLGTSTVRLPGRSGCIQMRSTSASGTTLAATPIAPQLISSMSEGSSAT